MSYTGILGDLRKTASKVVAFQKVSYVSHCPGHKNSQGQLAEWCVKSHETGKIISSHGTEAAAKKHLQDMHAHSGSAKFANYNVMCRVSGGVTGTREAVLKSNGKVQVFETEEQAKAEASKLTKSHNSPYSTAHFQYWAVPAEDGGFDFEGSYVPKTADDLGPNGMEPAQAEQLLSQIGAGDRVTILVPAGRGMHGQEWKESTGKAVMKGPHGWALNMGGQYGTPGVATNRNIVKVKKYKHSDDEQKSTGVGDLIGPAANFIMDNPEILASGTDKNAGNVYNEWEEYEVWALGQAREQGLDPVEVTESGQVHERGNFYLTNPGTVTPFAKWKQNPQIVQYASKTALDKKHEWEVVYEELKDILDRVAGMNEKPPVQAQLMDLIATAKAQAQLWSNPQGVSPAHMSKMKKTVAALRAAAVAAFGPGPNDGKGGWTKGFHTFAPAKDQTVNSNCIVCGAPYSANQHASPPVKPEAPLQIDFAHPGRTDRSPMDTGIGRRGSKKAADIMHSDDELDKKVETQGAPVLPGKLEKPESGNVNAMREAIEEQSIQEVGKPIQQTQAEVDNGVQPNAPGNPEDGAAPSVEVSKTPDGGAKVVININAAEKHKYEGLGNTICNREGCGRTLNDPIHSGRKEAAVKLEPEALQHFEACEFVAVPKGADPVADGGPRMFYSDDWESHDQPIPAGTVCDFYVVQDMGEAYFAGSGTLEQGALLVEEYENAFYKNSGGKAPDTSAGPLNKNINEMSDIGGAPDIRLTSAYVKTAAIRVSRGEDAQGFHMVIDLGGRDYVLRGTDADNFHREYAMIPKPEIAVNALVQKYMDKLQPYNQKPKAVIPPRAPKNNEPSAPGKPDIRTWLKRQEEKERQPAMASLSRKAQFDMKVGKIAADSYFPGQSEQQQVDDKLQTKEGAPKAPAAPQRPEDISQKMIDTMGMDNGAIFAPTPEMAKMLVDGIKIMQAAGCKFTDDEIETLTYGEETDQLRLVKKWGKGGQMTHKALNLIFEGPSRARRGYTGSKNAGRHMGKCKECGKDKSLDENNLCQPCAKKALDDKTSSVKFAHRYRLYTGPTLVQQTAQKLQQSGVNVTVEGTENVIIESPEPDSDALTLQLRNILGAQWGVKNVQKIGAGDPNAHCSKHETFDKDCYDCAMAFWGKATPYKNAAFNFFFPGQVLKEFYPGLQHEVVDYPNDDNHPMIEDIDIGQGNQRLGALIDAALNTTKLSYPYAEPSTSPAAGAGIGRDGKPQVLDGAPLRKEQDIRGPMFTEEFYQNFDGLPSAVLSFEHTASWPKTAAGTPDEIGAFSLFLNMVCGEIAATMLSAFKCTGRPLMTGVPGEGKVNLVETEQPSIIPVFAELPISGSRIVKILDKLNDSEIRDAVNQAAAQSSVWHESKAHGFVYEVFVRAKSIDTDSAILTYEFITSAKQASSK